MGVCGCHRALFSNRSGPISLTPVTSTHGFYSCTCVTILFEIVLLSLKSEDHNAAASAANLPQRFGVDD